LKSVSIAALRPSRGLQDLWWRLEFLLKCKLCVRKKVIFQASHWAIDRVEWYALQSAAKSIPILQS